MEWLSDFSKHPFVIFAFGAVVSIFLVPYFTRKWQKQKYEYELRVKLSQEVGEIFYSLLTAVSNVHITKVNGEADQVRTVMSEMNQKYSEFEVASLICELRLKTFVYDEELRRRFSSLREAITLFYSLEGITNGNRYLATFKQVQEKLQTLSGYDVPASDIASHRDEWPNLRQSLLETTEELTEAILKVKVRSYV